MGDSYYPHPSLLTPPSSAARTNSSRPSSLYSGSTGGTFSTTLSQRLSSVREGASTLLHRNQQPSPSTSASSKFNSLFKRGGSSSSPPPVTPYGSRRSKLFPLSSSNSSLPNLSSSGLPSDEFGQMGTRKMHSSGNGIGVGQASSKAARVLGMEDTPVRLTKGSSPVKAAKLLGFEGLESEPAARGTQTLVLREQERITRVRNGELERVHSGASPSIQQTLDVHLHSTPATSYAINILPSTRPPSPYAFPAPSHPTTTPDSYQGNPLHRPPAPVKSGYSAFSSNGSSESGSKRHSWRASMNLGLAAEEDAIQREKRQRAMSTRSSLTANGNEQARLRAGSISTVRSDGATFTSGSSSFFASGNPTNYSSTHPALPPILSLEPISLNLSSPPNSILRSNSSTNSNSIPRIVPPIPPTPTHFNGAQRIQRTNTVESKASTVTRTVQRGNALNSLEGKKYQVGINRSRSSGKRSLRSNGNSFLEWSDEDEEGSRDGHEEGPARRGKSFRDTSSSNGNSTTPAPDSGSSTPTDPIPTRLLAAPIPIRPKSIARNLSPPPPSSPPHMTRNARSPSPNRLLPLPPTRNISHSPNIIRNARSPSPNRRHADSPSLSRPQSPPPMAALIYPNSPLDTTEMELSPNSDWNVEFPSAPAQLNPPFDKFIRRLSTSDPTLSPFTTSQHNAPPPRLQFTDHHLPFTQQHIYASTSTPQSQSFPPPYDYDSPPTRRAQFHPTSPESSIPDPSNRPLYPDKSQPKTHPYTRFQPRYSIAESLRSRQSSTWSDMDDVIPLSAFPEPPGAEGKAWSTGKSQLQRERREGVRRGSEGSFISFV